MRKIYIEKIVGASSMRMEIYIHIYIYIYILQIRNRHYSQTSSKEKILKAFLPVFIWRYHGLKHHQTKQEPLYNDNHTKTITSTTTWN